MSLLLHSLYPLEPYLLLQSRIQRISVQKFTLGLDNADKVIVHVKVDDKQAILGTFPPNHAVALTILFQKWAYYQSLYDHISAMQPESADLLSRRHDLLDHWMREVLYLDRILELAIQWSHIPDHTANCDVLCTFLTQEAYSSDHSPANVPAQNDTCPQNDPLILDDSESL